MKLPQLPLFISGESVAMVAIAFACGCFIAFLLFMLSWVPGSTDQKYLLGAMAVLSLGLSFAKPDAWWAIGLAIGLPIVVLSPNWFVAGEIILAAVGSALIGFVVAKFARRGSGG